MRAGVSRKQVRGVINGGAWQQLTTLVAVLDAVGADLRVEEPELDR